MTCTCQKQETNMFLKYAVPIDSVHMDMPSIIIVTIIQNRLNSNTYYYKISTNWCYYFQGRRWYLAVLGEQNCLIQLAEEATRLNNVKLILFL